MQKQFILAIVLSFLVIYGWSVLFPPPKPTPPPQKVTSAPSGAAAPQAQAGVTAQPAVETELPKALVAAESEKDIVVENAAVTAVFTTRGGTLKSWRLKN